MAIKSDFTPIDKKLESLVTHQEKLEYLEACLVKRSQALADFKAYNLADLERLKIKTANDFIKWQDSFDEGNLFMFHESTNKHHEKRLGLDNIELLIKRIKLENQYKNIIKEKSLFEAKIREIDNSLKRKKTAPRISDSDFVNGKIIERFPVYENIGESVIHYFEIEKEGEIRRYEIVQYLNFVAECFYLSCDAKESLNEKLAILYEAEFALKELIRTHKLDTYNCDYSQVILRLSECVKRYEKHNALSSSQLQGLETAKETNEGLIYQFQYSHIFKGNAFEVWQSMFDAFKITSQSRTDVKFVYQEMKKHGLIHNTVNQKKFLDWINDVYQIVVSKTSNHSRTKERLFIYDTAKSKYKE